MINILFTSCIVYILVVAIVENYGWFILIVALAIIYAYIKYKPSYESWSNKQQELRDEAEAKKSKLFYK